MSFEISARKSEGRHSMLCLSFAPASPAQVNSCISERGSLTGEQSWWAAKIALLNPTSNGFGLID